MFAILLLPSAPLLTDYLCDCDFKSVKLSINSPNLPFTREARLSEDVEIHFTPQSTGIGVIHRRGHFYLLTDLFLICERMTPDERSRSDSILHEMWLCYPPLAIKHVRPEPFDGGYSCTLPNGPSHTPADLSIDVTILKKERMILRFDSSSRRDEVLKEFKSTVATAASCASIDILSFHRPDLFCISGTSGEDTTTTITDNAKCDSELIQ